MKEKKSEFVGYIYGLYDPNTDELRYVGKTTKSLNRRLWFHMNEVKNGCTTHKCNWIRSLGCEPLIKEMMVIENGDRKELNNQLNLNEVRLIDELSYEHDLTNSTLGGEGCLGYKHTEENKKHISSIHKGKNVSDETRKKIGEKSKGRVCSFKTKEKISKSLRGVNNHFYGKKHTEQTKLKISENHKNVNGENNPSAKLTWDLVNEIRVKYLSGVKKGRLLELYVIPSGTMASVINNRTWKCDDYLGNLNKKRGL